jgi:phage shock protein PspC (stress-responsive transcriptional regulator)
MEKQKIKKEEQKTKEEKKIKRLYKSSDDKMIGGVCAGIAEYFNVDPTLIRLVWLLLGLAGGTGFVAYLVAWIIIPENPGSNKNQEAKNIKEESSRWVLGLILILIGWVFMINRIFPRFSFHTFWPVILIIIGMVILLRKE